jgi:hypothetical protein
MFMDTASRWVLDVSLFGQETCAKLSYFLPRYLWLLCLFLNTPMKFEYVKVEDAADMWVPILDYLNNKRVLSGFFIPRDCWLVGFYFEPIPKIPT